MISLSPEQQDIAEAIRQVKSGIASGEICIEEGAVPFRRYALVQAVCQRLGVAYLTIAGQVYDVLRQLEEDGQSQ